MGLLDKVKAQATAATEMAKDAAAKGQAKMNDAQAKKIADGMLRDLGAAFYATKTGRSTPTTDADIDAAGRRAAGVRVRARADHPGARVRGGRPDGDRCRRRLDGARPTAAPEGGRPGVPAAPSADGADAVACRARPAPWRRPVGHVGCLSSPRGGAVW